jgi:uncharacterized protein with FMN-binding domain
MNLNGGKSSRARLGFASMLGAVVLVVVGKSVTGSGEQPAALSMPSGTGGTSQPSSTTSAAGAGAGSAGAMSPAAAASPSAATGSSAAAAGTAASPAPSSTAASGSSGTRKVVGDAQDTRYGAVQVELVLTGNKITDVITLQVPNRERRDVEINDQAVPILREEVLAAQSAKIDMVSGASYTSSGYAWSVQSAIDKAGLPS